MTYITEERPINPLIYHILRFKIINHNTIQFYHYKLIDKLYIIIDN